MRSLPSASRSRRRGKASAWCIVVPAAAAQRPGAVVAVRRNFAPARQSAARMWARAHALHGVRPAVAPAVRPVALVMRLSGAAHPPPERARSAPEQKRGGERPSAVPPSQNRKFLRSRASLFTQLRSASRRADIRKATELYEKILEDKLSPNVSAFNDMLLACAKAGQVSKAFRVYNRLKKHGVSPNQETFNYLINACAEASGSGQFLERALWLKDHEMPKFSIFRLPVAGQAVTA